MANHASKVVEIALAEVGYLEKASNSQLDSKTANVGSGNFTKYSRDLDAISGFYNGKKQGYSWCEMFVDWCFVQAYGVEAAKKLLCQPDNSAGAGCGFSADYYKQKNQFHTGSPKVGDQIFYWNSEKNAVAHTGLVYKVDSSKVYTVEGNTSSASGVVANGGSVCVKSYDLTNDRIYGYGRPGYAAEPVAESYTLKQFIQDVQAATGAAVDGIAGPETLSKTITVCAEKNNTHAVVKPVQKRLYALGYTTVGNADGIAGSRFTGAVKQFQKDNGCVQDGEITARNMTWKKLLGMA